MHFRSSYYVCEVMLLWLINTVIKVTMSVFCLRGVAAVLLLLMLLSTLFISAHSSFVLCVFSSSPLQFVLMEWKMECLRYTEMNRATQRVWCQCYMLQGISSSIWRGDILKSSLLFFRAFCIPVKRPLYQWTNNNVDEKNAVRVRF